MLNSHTGKPEQMGTKNEEGRFHEVRNDLEDESCTFDVYFSDQYGQQLIAEAASHCAAEEMSDALQKLRRRFLECGSDREVLSLATAFASFIERHEKAT